VSESARFAGIYPMLYTFFRADGSLDPVALRRQVEACVAGRANGMAVLGLASEVRALSVAERRQMMDWTADALGRRLPLAITIYEPTVAAQIESARHARAVGADWVILQPPPGGQTPEAELIDFFSRVGDGIGFPFAIQNAPEYLGVGLTPEGIGELARRCGNFRLLKGEGPAVRISEIVEAMAGRLTVFNGRGGLEIADNLRAGCAGIIPAIDCFDALVKVHAAFTRGDERAADAAYARVLPVIVFVMQSLETLLTYGKALAARRLGLPPPIQRDKTLQATSFGLACLARLAGHLGPLP
jgi:4-hydroxy-tetrahydrodipicolinate synthase